MRSVVLLCIALVGFVSAAFDSSLDEAWGKFKKTHAKEYADSNEETLR